MMYRRWILIKWVANKRSIFNKSLLLKLAIDSLLPYKGVLRPLLKEVNLDDETKNYFS